MGLDMYFEAKKSRCVAYSHWDKEKGEVDKTNYPEDLQVLAEHIFNEHYKSLTANEYYHIGYFRKFNALHNIIIERFAEGEDICQEIYLFKEDIEYLLDICNQIKNDNSKAEELLPTRDGCCFGSTEYDEYYFKEIDRAINLFTLILQTINFDVYEIVYQASW